MVSSSFSRAHQTRPVGIWLICMALLVWAMVVVGGATRLTESGLSMVRWEPVQGAIPPLTDADWQVEFQAYQQYPEYKIKNVGMSLDEFKNIFWWEYSHRLLGRFIGFAFAIPFIWFLLSGRLSREMIPRLILFFILGGAQGALGWYMVASGLIDRPDVSHYRLTAHLMLAVTIFCLLLWTGMSMVRARTLRASTGLRAAAKIFIALVLIEIALGGLVAGLDAGFAYNTWPLMEGAFIPNGLLDMDPWWRNFFDSTLTVQFQHRMMAYAVATFGTGLALSTFFINTDPPTKLGAFGILFAVALQVTLGILTLLNSVPVALGTAHQAGGIFVLTMGLYYAHTLRRTR